MQKITLSIIVPVFNEEKTIGKLMEKLISLKLPNQVNKQIVAINDGSRDKTLDILLRYAGAVKIVNQEVNKGKGAAVIEGIKSSRGEILVIQDADLEYDPDDLLRLLKPIVGGTANVVYGTRLKNFPLRITGARKTPLITHFIGNKLLTLITNILYGGGITDMETCYKMFRREVLAGIKLYSNRFEFEPELTAKILKKGYKIKEVPIQVQPRGYEEGKKITWRDGFMAIWTLVKYRFMD